MPDNDQKVLKFKFLLNRTVEVGGHIFTIPMENKFKTVGGRELLLPEFNMHKVFEIPLFDETLQLPEREEGMSDRIYAELEDEAYMTSREARKENDKLRASAHYHERQGIIKIVDDPFARRKLKDTDRAVKPSDLAKEADEEKAAAAATKSRK